jgi:hypothetical protein
VLPPLHFRSPRGSLPKQHRCPRVNKVGDIRDISRVFQHAVHLSQRILAGTNKGMVRWRHGSEAISARAFGPRTHAAGGRRIARAGGRTVTGYAGGRPIPAPVAIVINLMVGVVTSDQVDAVR